MHTKPVRDFLAIDPGPTRSALVWFHGGKPTDGDTQDNDSAIETVAASCLPIVIEMVACYGQPVGAEVFETCVWIGRFIQVMCGANVYRMTRVQVKQAICHTVKGVSDAVLRQAMIDEFGPGKEKAIGTKKAPGPLYGIKGDEWAALALGVAWMRTTAAAALEVGR